MLFIRYLLEEVLGYLAVTTLNDIMAEMSGSLFVKASEISYNTILNVITD
jgi:hypothetical protein